MSQDYYILRRGKVFNDEHNIIKFETKEDYKKLKKEVSARRQYLNNVIYKRNEKENPLENQKYVIFPKNNHIKYIFCGSSGSGKTKNTMNMLKIYAAVNTKTTMIFYFSPIQEDTYRDDTLHKISEYTKGKVFFYNCELIDHLPPIKELYKIITTYKEELNEKEREKNGNKELKTNQYLKPRSICIFDDCESCTNRKVNFDNNMESISKCIYSIISSLSIAGRSHTQTKPTIEYICIQHNIAVGGQIRQFNTILLESNLLGLNYSTLHLKSIRYIEDKWGVELPKKKIFIPNQGNVNNPDYPQNKFCFFTLTYPHLLMFDEKCINLSN